MKVITCHGGCTRWRRSMPILGAVACLSFLSSCNQAPPNGVQGTNHAQDIATFLGDFAREILAAYLF